MNKRRISLIAVVVTGLLALSSVAMAEEDTVLNYGYDEGNHFLLINLAPLSPLDTTETTETCEPPTDTATPYTIDGDSVSFDDIEGTEGCSMQAIDVTGPAGQINQGMFMKAFNTFLGNLELEHGRGCLIRHLAQSTLGIDHQIRTPDALDDFEAGEEGSAKFTTVLADCEHGDEDEIEGEADTQGNGNGNGKGRPEGKGRPDSPGKSASAPGRAGR